jgi:hypothetical protein
MSAVIKQQQEMAQADGEKSSTDVCADSGFTAGAGGTTAAAASRKRKGKKDVSDSSDTDENVSAGEYGPSPTKVAKTSAAGNPIDDGILESSESGLQAGPRAAVPVLGSPIKIKKGKSADCTPLVTLVERAVLTTNRTERE